MAIGVESEGGGTGGTAETTVESRPVLPESPRNAVSSATLPALELTGGLSPGRPPAARPVTSTYHEMPAIATAERSESTGTIHRG